jgi:hypothetical protein
VEYVLFAKTDGEGRVFEVVELVRPHAPCRHYVIMPAGGSKSLLQRVDLGAACTQMDSHASNEQHQGRAVGVSPRL